MRLFLIRHGETVDNVAGNYAGITDSALTNHGVLQANRLGVHLATTAQVKLVFSSDLQRAFRTAEAVREAQEDGPSNTKKLELLREQNFGFYEGKQFFERPKEDKKSGKDAHLEAHRNDPGFRDVESKESMRQRMETFVDDHLVHLLHTVEAEHAVVVVAHGIILNHLWRVILKRFPAGNVGVLPGVQAADRGFSLEYLGGWSNTGYLELEIKPKADKIHLPAAPAVEVESSTAVLGVGVPLLPSTTTDHDKEASNKEDSSTENVPQKPATSPLPIADPASADSKILELSLLIRAVNSQAHLRGLKKTRGGIGNLKHDSNQKTMDSFFKKRRLE